MANFTRRKVKVMIFAGCDACGQVHAVAFDGLDDFVRLICPVESVPIYRTPTEAKAVFKTVQRDLLSGAVAA